MAGKMTMNTPVADRLARYERVLALKEKGMSLRAIGKEISPDAPLSAERIRQILAGGPPGLPGNPAFREQGKEAEQASS